MIYQVYDGAFAAPHPQSYVAAFLQLRIIPGEKAFQQRHTPASLGQHETKTRGHFYCGMTLLRCTLDIRSAKADTAQKSAIRNSRFSFRAILTADFPEVFSSCLKRAPLPEHYWEYYA